MLMTRNLAASATKAYLAVIDAIQWHHRDAKPIYFVRRDGKRDSRRYSEAELVQRFG